MYRAEVAKDGAPYLEPEYWGGVMIGQQTNHDLPKLERTSLMMAAINGEDIAISSLERVFHDRTNLSTRAIYVNGETFSPEDHDYGAVVFYRKEVLLNDPKKAERLVNIPNGRSLPFGITYSRAPSVGPNDFISREVKPPYIYYVGERVGVITDVNGKNSSKELIYLSSLSNFSWGDKQSTGVRRTNKEETPFNVGITRRYTTKGGAEMLIRVNDVRVCKVDSSPRGKRRKPKKTKVIDKFAEFVPSGDLGLANF